ncbi:MAG: hypothetical protein KJS64_06595 [Acidobacteria bacterium]|nr:hypothetical protein [Acidobacteriota bacterium]
MTCWNCHTDVPMAPFCRNCGAALPDPDTRRAAITTRLSELENERRVLESQLARVNGASTPVTSNTGAVASPAPAAATAPPSTTPVTSPVPATSTSTPVPRSSQLAELSPSLLITLIGVVLLGVASFVSAKEHEPLVSLSHSTRLIVLLAELVIATATTLSLAKRRPQLADAFGSLSWAAGLSFAYLATVNVTTGVIPSVWEYSLPFIVALPILLLTRLALPITRFLSFGTLVFGIWNLEVLGLTGSDSGQLISMLRGVVVMVLIAVICATILWVAYSSRGHSLTTAEKALGYIGVAFLFATTSGADLPLARSVGTAILAFIGVASMSLPLVVGAIGLRRRTTPNAALGAQVYAIAAGLLLYNAITAVSLGTPPSHGLLFPEALFTGSRNATVWFPVLMSLVAAGAVALALRTTWKVAGWILTAVALIPSLGSIAASLRWEFLGYLGGDVTAADLRSQFGFPVGWFGRGVSIADVPSVVVAVAGSAIALALLLAARSRTDARGPRVLRQIGVVVLTATTLATVLRYTPVLSAPRIVAVSLAVLAVGSFFTSRFWNDAAPCDEWLPSLFLGGALASAGVVRSHSSLTVSLTSHVTGVLTGVLGLAILLGLAAAYRRRDTWRAAVGLGVQGPLLLVMQFGHHPHHIAWQFALVAVGTLALYAALVTFAHPEKRWVTIGAAVPALLLITAQLVEMDRRGQYFRIAVTVLVVTMCLAAARRRSPLATPVLIGAAVIAGLTWSHGLHGVDYLGLWIAGGSLVLLALLRGVSDDAWTTLGSGLLFGFIPSVMYVTSDGTTLSRSIVIGLAVITTIAGYVARRDAAIEIGAVAAAFSLNVNSPTSTVWTVVAVGLSVLWFLVGTQQRFAAWRVTARSSQITMLAGIAAWVIALLHVATHVDRALVVVLVGLITVSAARRLGALFDGMLLVTAAGIVGVFWTASFDALPGAGLWIAAGGVLLLTLSLGVDRPEHRSWVEWGPALLFVMVPANYGALSGSVLSAAITIVVAVVLIIIAIAQRKRAVFDVAIATFAILSVARLSQVVSDRSRWIVAVVLGVALIGNGLWRETRKSRDDDATSASWYRSLT